jgi:beta-glucanase (GH16 family)
MGIILPSLPTTDPGVQGQLWNNSGVLMSSAGTAPVQPVGIPGTWTLEFDEEFNGDSLNTDIWTPGWFNTPISNPVNSLENDAYNSDNVSVSGGYLHLALTDVSITAPNSTTYPYTASLISSNPNGSNTGFLWGPYGVLEYRIYMPGGGDIGNGIINWPAAWATTMPDETYNEYDLFEGLSGFGAWHFHDDSGAVGANTSAEPGWHTVAVNWQPGSLTYYYDGVEVGSVSSGVLGNPVYLILNHSVNTDWTPATFGEPFLVDYARVWSGS